ncbi:MAG: hypothetical protein IJS17_05470 [Clostridia bacterium]|nr:hypothetical protein [Clostridia bacterium]
MLGKLIKHDFIGSAHSMFAVYLVALISLAVTALSYVFDIKFLKFIGAVSLVIVVLGLVLITTIIMMNYFNKSLYSDQGYLSYTLPAKSKDILISKAIVSFVWLAISYLVLVGTVVGTIWYAKAKLGESLGADFDELLDMFSAMTSGGGLPTASAIAKIIATALIYGFVTILVLVAEVFFSMTLANVKPFNKLGFFGGILIFVAVYIILQIISALVMVYFPISLFISGDGIKLAFKSMNEVSNTFGIGGLIVQVIAAVGMFFATNHLMSKKINLR